MKRYVRGGAGGGGRREGKGGRGEEGMRDGKGMGAGRAWRACGAWDGGHSSHHHMGGISLVTLNDGASKIGERRCADLVSCLNSPHLSTPSPTLR